MLASVVLALVCTAHAARPPNGAHGLRSASSSLMPWLPSWAALSFTSKNEAGGGGDAGECEDGEIRKNGLKAIKEMPFIGLFENLRDVSKFEASGMTTAQGKLWIVFDNLHSIGRIEERFTFRDPDNILLGHLGEDSQFEGLSYDDKTGHFYVVEEVVEQGDTHLHPVAQEIRMDEKRQTYDIIERCPIHFQLSHQNKGFEGIHFYRDPKDPDREFLIGLCEGNWCKGGRRGREVGNGRLVVSSFYKNSTGCGWDVVKVVNIPPVAAFQDYSGIDFRDDRVAIISQEDSAMYVGYFDFEALDFTLRDEERIYHFPRDNHCDMIYCNVEGVAWLDDFRVIIASDKAKSTQPYRCTPHDQSIGIFALPN